MAARQVAGTDNLPSRRKSVQATGGRPPAADAQRAMGGRPPVDDPHRGGRIRRCGELLKQIPRANGANQNIIEGAHNKVGRSLAAAQAGLSEWRTATALRVASAPLLAGEAVERSAPDTEGIERVLDPGSVSSST